jgi:hypothetical protein
MLQLCQRHVASIRFECFKCFRGIFHLCFPDACYKCVYLDIAYVSHIRYMCFIWMFASDCNGFQVFFMCFFICFISMF